MLTKTRILQIDPLAPDAVHTSQAAQIIQAGGLVAFPTETVYGLGANALDADAIHRIFEAKQRPTTDPIIAHISNVEALTQLTDTPASDIGTLIEAFWPGPLTLVLPRREKVPANLSAHMPTVAVRMPAHPVAAALIDAAGVPIAAPSANLFSRPSATTAQHVLADLDGRVDIILDAGPTLIGVESTVLDLTASVPTILRPGGTSVEALREYLPDVVLLQKWHSEKQAGQSPGMMTKHYSPQAQVIMLKGSREAILKALHARLTDSNAEQSVGILLSDADLTALAPPKHVFKVSLGLSAQTAATRLFAALRQMDEAGVDVILTRLPAYSSPLNAALQDRLMRAAEGQVIEVR